MSDGMASSEPVRFYNYGQAYDLMRDGHKVRQTGWNGKGQWVKRVDNAFVVMEDGTTIKLKPFIVLHNAQGELIPWIPSQGDQDSCTWELVE